MPSDPTDTTNGQFMDNLLSLGNLANLPRDRIPSTKTVKDSMKGDSTPVSHMATRGHGQQRQTTNEKDNSIPLPAFQVHEEAVTP